MVTRIIHTGPVIFPLVTRWVEQALDSWVVDGFDATQPQRFLRWVSSAGLADGNGLQFNQPAGID